MNIHDLVILGKVEDIENHPAREPEKKAELEIHFRLPGGDRVIVRTEDPKITNVYRVTGNE